MTAEPLPPHRRSEPADAGEGGPAEVDQHYLMPYREAVARYGPTFQATLWRSADAQLLRFDVLIDLVGSELMHDAVLLDAGCGRGDLAAHLLEREVAFARMIGIDGVGELVTAARERHLPRCTFEVGDFVADERLFERHAPDYVFFSGSLNTLSEERAMAVVCRAFAGASQGVALNFLGDRHHPRYAGERLEPARRFSVLRWFDMALNLTSRVIVTQEYLDGHDVAMLLRHD